MRNILNRIKTHWFGLIITLFALFYAGLILIIIFSPRIDRFDRGFIPCTKQMLTQLETCSTGKTLCMAKLIIRNNFCDIGVITTGFSDWIKGRQPRPWSNYLFEPELTPSDDPEDDENDELLQEYYQNNPNIDEQMETLNRQRLELEKKLEDKLKELKENVEQLPE